MTPQQNWVATTDGRHGLALIAPGQYESAVLDQPDRPLCVTLLRAFRKAVFTDGNEGGQIQGTHRFRLALKPFMGGIPTVELFHLSQMIAAPARTVCLEKRDLLEKETLPAPRYEQLPGIDGPVVISAAHRSDRHVVFRVFNPADKPAKISLRGKGRWHVTDMRGNMSAEVAEPSWNVAPKQIVTLRFDE